METSRQTMLLGSVACLRHVALGFPDDTTIVARGTQKKFGHDYQDFLYQIVGSDDLVRIRRYENGAEQGVYEPGYFKKRKEYADTVGALSRKYKIPFKVALAIGDNEKNYEAFHSRLEDVDGLQISTLRDLHAGIIRRKGALKEILGNELYEALQIEDMGPEHSKRIALFVWDRAMSRINN